ncbi:unnamed protein product [Rotaria socialis]|uniref:Uncharacterized protein n=1 Tax=Rotaria socialis TaxID=392032 RepID=A0A821G1P3_9BILA|nr:unnamed protein product [Rotaria socialis]CAF4118568.1 unnamed protein product [Rotaria socialis]CAF4202504.1 unnamed protein product [Rotaria socialis]CAF4658299.1 unnamed protein product [Rotaria socialis]
MKHMGNKLSSPVDQQISFIETGPGNLNYHIFNHPKKYRTAAFPALGYGLANCPADVVAKAIIDAAISKIQKTTVHCTVKITNEQGETCNIDFKKLKEIFNHRIRPMRRQNLANYSLPVRWQSQSTDCTRFLLDEY